MDAIGIYLGAAGWLMALLVWLLFVMMVWVAAIAFVKNQTGFWKVFVSVLVSMMVFGTVIISLPSNGSLVMAKIQEFIVLNLYPLMSVLLLGGFMMVKGGLDGA